MHRPGLSELEALMKHAESLPVDAVDGQAHLRFARMLLLRTHDFSKTARLISLVGRVWYAVSSGLVQYSTILRWSTSVVHETSTILVTRLVRTDITMREC